MSCQGFSWGAERAGKGCFEELVKLKRLTYEAERGCPGKLEYLRYVILGSWDMKKGVLESYGAQRGCPREPGELRVIKKC